MLSQQMLQMQQEQVGNQMQQHHEHLVAAQPFKGHGSESRGTNPGAAVVGSGVGGGNAADRSPARAARHGERRGGGGTTRKQHRGCISPTLSFASRASSSGYLGGARGGGGDGEEVAAR